VSSEAVLLEAARRFLPVNPDRMIFTKLDEAVNLGVLLTVARRVSLRLSYVTTGQEVPDHIETGKSERLVRMLLDGSIAR
jgi:flagellar biosynthesis protein FlhF